MVQEGSNEVSKEEPSEGVPSDRLPQTTPRQIAKPFIMDDISRPHCVWLEHMKSSHEYMVVGCPAILYSILNLVIATVTGRTSHLSYTISVLTSVLCAEYGHK